MSNIFITLKKDLFGCFTIEEIRDKANETGLQGGRRNRNVNLQVLSIYAMSLALSFALNYLPSLLFFSSVDTICSVTLFKALPTRPPTPSKMLLNTEVVLSYDDCTPLGNVLEIVELIVRAKCMPSLPTRSCKKVFTFCIVLETVLVQNIDETH